MEGRCGISGRLLRQKGQSEEATSQEVPSSLSLRKNSLSRNLRKVYKQRNITGNNKKRRKMFYIIRLKRNVIISPEDMGPKFRRHVETYLRRAVEGVEIQPYGFVIAVVDIFDGDNMIAKVLDDGSAKIVVEYDALLFRLNKDEVVDAIVERVTPEGLFCEVGPATVHVPRSKIPEVYGYDATTSMVARYVTLDADGSHKSIAPGTVVRVKVLAEVVRSKDFAFRAVCSMVENPFLGPRS